MPHRRTFAAALQGLSLTRKSAALRHPWLRWPPTPAPGARAAPPRTSIGKNGASRKSDLPVHNGRRRRRDRRTLEERRAAAAQATKLLPSRSRCATESECIHGSGVPTRSTGGECRKTDGAVRPTLGRKCRHTWATKLFPKIRTPRPGPNRPAGGSTPAGLWGLEMHMACQSARVTKAPSDRLQISFLRLRRANRGVWET